MAEPNKSLPTVLVPSTSSATKRSSGGDVSDNKRPKTVQQNEGKPIFDMNTVVLEHERVFVAKVPLLNFQTFAPEKVKDLVEISGNDCSGWKFHAYNASVLGFERDVERWASWLINRDLHGVVSGGFGVGFEIGSSLIDAEQIRDVDYQDALVDRWMLWLQEGQSAGGLRVNHLRYRYSGPALIETHNCLSDLGKALVLYHDGDAGMSESTDNNHHYADSTRRAIRVLAQDYFSKHKREPKDPLELSADEFCQKYHSHHKKNLPCYRTKKLPKQTSSA
ncbi:hypothetical protein KCU92_g4592, partial [Aureobasidium melanogenum]